MQILGIWEQRQGEESHQLHHSERQMDGLICWAEDPEGRGTADAGDPMEMVPRQSWHHGCIGFYPISF